MAQFFAGVLCLALVGLSTSQQWGQPSPQQQQQQTQQQQNYPGAGLNRPSGSGAWSQQPQSGQFNQYNNPPQQQQQQSNNPNYYSNSGAGVAPGSNPSARAGVPMRFCTVNQQEHQGCQQMIFDLSAQNLRSAPGPYGRNKRMSNVRFAFSCVQATDKLECMSWIGKQNKADVVLASAGEAFVGAKEYNLVPLAYEGIGVDRVNFEEQIVAVTRAQSQINSVQQLSQKNACFGAVGDSVWNHVMANLRATQVLGAPPPCDGSNMDSAVRFFGDMCAPYDKRNFTDTENNKYRKLCTLCGGQNCPDSPGQMAVQNDALNCLLQNERADVAFLSAPVLAESLKANTFGEPHLFHVLCPQSQKGSLPLVAQQGGSLGVQEWSECFLGRTPTNVWLTRQGIENIVDMAERLNEIYFTGGGGAISEKKQRSMWLDSFFTGTYPNNQLTTRFTMVRGNSPDSTELDRYLNGFAPYMEDKVSCPTQERARWCTTSVAEQEKCQMMQKAFKVYRLRPELECEAPVKNNYVCLEKINANKTDLVLIDIGDLVTAGNYYNAIQIAQERYTAQDQYGGTTTAIDEPFSVAVVKDAGISQLASLRDKKACFTGLWDAHGFMLPLDSIKKNVLGDQSDCRHLQTAQDFFGDSCLPGLADGEPLNHRNEQPKEKLCRQCNGGERGCSRGAGQTYAGPLGALRCLREGKGDVAFVPHTALSLIPQSEQSSYYLVCNGAQQSLDNYANCNLGKAPGSVLVTNRYKGAQEKRRLQDMILTASRLFSADLSAQFNSGSISSASFSSSSAEQRSRKTYTMFGPRTKADVTANQFGSVYPTFGRPTQPLYNSAGTVNPTALGSTYNSPIVWNTVGEYALFGPGAFDLRGFGDINQTSIADALQGFRTIGELSDWKRCFESAAMSNRISGMTGVLVLFLAGIIRWLA